MHREDAWGSMFETLTPDERQMALAACEVIQVTKRAGVASIQRRMRLGYTSAARIIDILEEAGIVGPPAGASPRAIYMDKLEEALGIASTSDPDGLLPIQPPSANDQTIDCPLCGGRILLSVIAPGANTCPKCRRVFTAEY